MAMLLKSKSYIQNFTQKLIPGKINLYKKCLTLYFSPVKEIFSHLKNLNTFEKLFPAMTLFSHSFNKLAVNILVS